MKKRKNTKTKFNLWESFSHALYSIFIITLSVGLVIVAYYFGYSKGFLIAKTNFAPATNYIIEETPKGTSSGGGNSNQSTEVNFGGPELWSAVNKRRVELGVNPLSTKSELCTIASIRLNELLELGTLDGHEGFSKLADREDLRWIFEKYNLTEFLVSGAKSADDAVSLWENTLGHKKLLTGGEYVWGCTYAQDGFGVAITAF